MESDGQELYQGQTADFLRETRRRFAWLEERGFEPRRVEPTFVDWHSEEVNVAVGFRIARDDAYRSVMMSLAPGNESDLEDYLSMYVVEQLIPPPDDPPFRPLGQALLRAENREEMCASLARIAELLRTQFAELLASEAGSVRALKEESGRRIREAARRVHSDDVRTAAREAFDAGDYPRATSLYESVAAELGRAERRRLSIARRYSGLTGR